MAKNQLDLSQPSHRHAAERLRNDYMMWLSTVRPDGRPHLVPVWFLWEEDPSNPGSGTILIFSKPDQKIRNLKQNNRVVVALDDTRDGADVLFIEGTARLLDPTEVDSTLPAYGQKYGAKLSSMGWTPESMAREYTEPIRITPTRFWAES